VTQTAIDVVANPPVGCEIEVMTNSNLAGIMEGRIRNWSKVESAEGECNSAITRVVRKDGSGTTYQFKNYLFKLFGQPLACTEGLVDAGKKATWQQLEPIGAEGKPNISWPESCPEQELSAVVRPAANGGGEVVKKVNTTPGSIGYASLPDSMANKAGNTRILALQNNGQKKGAEANFAEAANGTTANCEGITYQVPKLNGSLDFDWSQVFGAKPAVGSTFYPLCTLTYVMVWNDYSSVGYTEGVATTTRDYIYEYVVQAGGQAAINSNNYASLPGSGEPLFDVLGAAQKAAKNIAF
jgi:ABC-type phosphate transport system substrate-binding protein